MKKIREFYSRIFFYLINSLLMFRYIFCIFVIKLNFIGYVGYFIPVLGYFQL